MLTGIWARGRDTSNEARVRATWADPDDPTYQGLMGQGAVVITTWKVPLQTPLGLTTLGYLWYCPACRATNYMPRYEHPATEPAELAGHPSQFRARFDPGQVLKCAAVSCGAQFKPRMLAPYNRTVDQYRLVTARIP